LVDYCRFSPVLCGHQYGYLRADREFEKIKQSISNEYSILVDKMLAPEKTDVYTYCYDLSNSTSTSLFLAWPDADRSLVEIFLDSMVLNLFRVDAVWFFNNDGSLHHHSSHRGVNHDALSFIKPHIDELFNGKTNNNFYFLIDNTLYRVFGFKVGNVNNQSGFVFAATAQDNWWIERYEKEINNSDISIESKGNQTTPIPKDMIRIERGLNGFDGSTVAVLHVNLKLPFLKLWHSTTSTDKFLITIALVVMLALLIFFIVIWVISPLKHISGSLQKGNSNDIIPLLNTKTEMGDVARMIGDYHKKKDELEASESMKRYIIEQAQVGIIIVDAKTNLIDTANPYACELIAAPEDVVVGNAHVNFLSSYDNIENQLNKPSGESKSHESWLFNTKGEKIPILRNVKKIFMDGRQVYMETFVDLSQIKDLQSKLEEEKLKLDLAMKNSGLNFCEYDFKTDNLTISEEWKFLTKGKSESIAVNLLNNIYHSDLKNITDQFDSLKTRQRDTMSAEFRVEHPVKGLIWLSLSILITKRDENSAPKQLIGLFEDITERINVQQELIKAKEKAEESDRMKTAYLTNMSHKIRTPMNAIVGFANLLTEEGFSQEEKETYIKIISRDTEQLLHLIDDIINMARLDAEQLELDKKSISMNQLFEELTGYYKANEKTQKIKFESKSMLPDGKDLVRTDKVKLRLILNSLLNNAFKFTNEGSIEFGCFVNPVNNKLTLYVKDTGIGIPEESKDKIFNRFYQADPRTEGTGLGLTISLALAKLLNGKISFESQTGIGSNFVVELPFE
jgi:PAS domain S-box-containing protein